MKDILDNPLIYRLWQSPFNEQKIAPVRKLEHLWRGKTVLDIGCGPGINVGLFESVSRYVGVDVNEAYVRQASQRVSGDGTRTFLRHDALEPLPSGIQPDLIFCSSVLHHFSDEQVEALFQHLNSLNEDRLVFILVDLILPQRRSVAKVLAEADRGEFPRSPERWNYLLSKYLTIESVAPFSIRRLGIDLWYLFLMVGTINR